MALYNIHFSPTGGTKKAADCLTRALGGGAVEIDLIRDRDALARTAFTAEDVCVVAVPSFGGRVPSPAAALLRGAHGAGAKAVLVAVFGNRAIDDTLAELQDILVSAGFTCLAGVEAAAQHSLMPQYGAGRPDADDEAQLADFAARIREKLAQDGADAPQLPGSHEYRVYNGVPFRPLTSRKCTACGLCARECPADAIPPDAPNTTDNAKCVACMHCVAVCPQRARHYSRSLRLLVSRKMRAACSGRKENRLYL